jgi:hypothetical protein
MDRGARRPCLVSRVKVSESHVEVESHVVVQRNCGGKRSLHQSLEEVEDSFRSLEVDGREGRMSWSSERRRRIVGARSGGRRGVVLCNGTVLLVGLDAFDTETAAWISAHGFE